MSAPRRRKRYGMDKDELPRTKRTEEPPSRETKLKLFGKAKNKPPKGKGKKKLPMKSKMQSFGALRNVRSA